MRRIWLRFTLAARKPAMLSLAGIVLVLGSIEDRAKGCGDRHDGGSEPAQTQPAQGGSSYQLNHSVQTPSGG
jgi:hypothetical protein